MRFGIKKLIHVRNRQIKVIEKCKMLCQMGQIKDRALIVHAFVKMAQMRVKHKIVCLAIKKIERF